MKSLLFIITTALIFAGCSSTRRAAENEMADTVLTAQLQQVIDQIPTEFASLKDKQLSPDVSTTAYSSTITLHGTFANQITEHGGRLCFIGKIAEVKTAELASQLVKQWTKKVEICLRNLETKEVPYRTGGAKSELVEGTVLFLSESHGVSVIWSKHPELNIFNVMVRVI